jgi:hypothetical protein
MTATGAQQEDLHRSIVKDMEMGMVDPILK